MGFKEAQSKHHMLAFSLITDENYIAFNRIIYIYASDSVVRNEVKGEKGALTRQNELCTENNYMNFKAKKIRERWVGVTHVLTDILQSLKVLFSISYMFQWCCIIVLHIRRNGQDTVAIRSRHAHVQ